MDKHLLVKQLLEQLGQEYRRTHSSAKRAADSVGHAENRPESKKDMRSTEASYFARGQAMRVEELSRSIQKIKFMDILNFSDDDAIAVSAVVQLQYEDESCRWYFLVPDAGGHELVMEKKNIVTLATISPLGQALIGKNRDDSFDFNIRGKLQEIEITELY